MNVGFLRGHRRRVGSDRRYGTFCGIRLTKAKHASARQSYVRGSASHAAYVNAIGCQLATAPIMNGVLRQNRVYMVALIYKVFASILDAFWMTHLHYCQPTPFNRWDLVKKTALGQGGLSLEDIFSSTYSSKRRQPSPNDAGVLVLRIHGSSIDSDAGRDALHPRQVHPDHSLRINDGRS